MKPNRTERLLHWRIELFKVFWTTALAAAAAVITLAINKIGGVPMGFTIIIGATALAVSLAMIWITWLAIRRLPDEPAGH